MSVTVMLGGTSEQISPAIQTGIHYAKRLGTNLTGLCAMPDPSTTAVYIAGAETVTLGASAIASMTEAQDKLAKNLEAVFVEHTKSAGAWLTAQFERKTGSVALHGAARASLSDALILPKEATDSGHTLNPVFEHVLMEAHLPLVLSPTKAKVSDTCVIAWDGSPLAARAIKMHLPLIETYKMVLIAENPDKIRHQWEPVCRDSKARLTDLLHQSRVQVKQVTFEGAVSDGLQKVASDYDASLIVMGAFVHNRLGQMLFGGTTSRLLHNGDSPALALCH
ncbi:MAG: universal stress protein [Pseudomonadota bacterium]